MPTLEEYINNGGFNRDAQASGNLGYSNRIITGNSGGSSYDPNVLVTPSARYTTPVNSPNYNSLTQGSVPMPNARPYNSAPVTPNDYAIPGQTIVPPVQDPRIQQLIDARSAAQAAEAAAAAKKQQYIDTQTGLYNNYFSQQQNSQLAALKNARDTALQGFNSSENVAQQNAYNNRNQVDIQGVQAAQKLREIMAAQGLMSSGDNVTANLQLDNQRQNALNNINQATSNTLQNVAEQRNLVNNQAASQEQSLIDKISADKTNALINLNQYGDQKEMDLNKFNYQQYIDQINNAYKQKQDDISNNINAAQLTGQYNGQQTVDSRYKDYVMAQGKLDSDRNYSVSSGQITGNFIPAGAQDVIARILNLKQAAESANTTPGDMQQYKATADGLRNQLLSMGINPSIVGYDSDYNTASQNLLNTNLGTPTVGQKQLDLGGQELKFKQDSYQQTFNENVRQFDTTTAIEKAYKEGQLSIQQAAKAIDMYQAQTSRMNAGTNASELAWRQNPENPDNKLKLSSIGKNDALTSKYLSQSGGTPNKNEKLAGLITDIDQMSPENRDLFFKEQKSNIIAEQGPTGYQRLYGMYYDKHGNPVGSGE